MNIIQEYMSNVDSDIPMGECKHHTKRQELSGGKIIPGKNTCDGSSAPPNSPDPGPNSYEFFDTFQFAYSGTDVITPISAAKNFMERLSNKSRCYLKGSASTNGLNMSKMRQHEVGDWNKRSMRTKLDRLILET